MDRSSSDEELEVSLRAFDILGWREPASISWMGGASLLLAMRPEVNGHVVVDRVDAPWPDEMGDPRSDPTLFGAWSLGFFGPHVFPGGLERAQSMATRWPEAERVVARHNNFLRVRSTYAIGAPQSPLRPEDYDPVPELHLVTQVALALLRGLKGLAYFNPNGETLADLTTVEGDLPWYAARRALPLPLWSNVRLFKVNSDWSLMDTVGMEQLDAIDHEACFKTGRYEPREVDQFLRNVATYVWEKGPIIKDGETADGPGGRRWRARLGRDSVGPPRRPVLRWFPKDWTLPPRELA